MGKFLLHFISLLLLSSCKKGFSPELFVGKTSKSVQSKDEDYTYFWSKMQIMPFTPVVVSYTFFEALLSFQDKIDKSV
jgi:hypothetical protein